MILTCPDCATRYFVDDRRLGPIGRTVRCASCGSSWRALAADEPPLELDASASADQRSSARGDEPLSFKPVEPHDMPAPELPKAFRAKAEQRRKARRAATAGAIWAGLACGFAAIMFAAWVFRVDVVRVFPRAAAAYALARVNATGLQFEGINAEPSVIDPGSVVVQGRVRNVVSVSAPVPMIRVALLDKRGFKVKTQILKLDTTLIAPGAAQSFRTTFPDPKAAAADVDVSFALDLAASPKPLRRIQVPQAPSSGLSQPAPVLRTATMSGPSAASPTLGAPPLSGPAPVSPTPPIAPPPARAATSSLPPHAAQGLRGLDSSRPLGVSPQPHG